MKKDGPRRRREIFKDPLTEVIGPDEYGEKKQDFLEGRISYNEGGANYFSGGSERRCYELGVSVITERERTRDDGTISRSTSFLIGGPGLRKIIKETARFNSKEFEALTLPAEEIDELKKKVIARWEERKVSDGS